MKYIKYKKHCKYKLKQTERIDTEIDVDTHNGFISLDRSRLIILEGYAWDGASGPTIDDKTNMRGSLIHDALYQLMREGLLDRAWRKYVDRLFHQICIEDGMNRFRAWYYYRAVRIFSRKYSFPQNDPNGKIIEIP